MTTFWTISRCRICGNTDLEPVLDLGTQALTGVFPKPGEDVPQGPLELVKCREDRNPDACGLVQLQHSFDTSLMYGQNYGYRSGLNASMVAHLQDTADTATRRLQLDPGDLVLDIGSNDSTLLRAIHEPGLQAVGMDPTGAKFQRYYPSHVHLIADFFTARRFQRDFGAKKAKLVTSIAMFYDLESPLDFMTDVHEILADDGIWVFEQSYLPMMLSARSYDTICHEHTEYYAFRQIEWMCARVGFTVIDVAFNDTNGGSFVVTAAKTGSPLPVNETAVSAAREEERRLNLADLATYRSFSDSVHAHRTELLSLLAELANSGKSVFGYGASTKGNVMLQFCGVTPAHIPYIAEVNPDKFGCVTPGTNIPIISEQEARAMKPDCFLVLPWHFRKDILRREVAYLRGGGALLFPLPQIDVVELQGESDPDRSRITQVS